MLPLADEMRLKRRKNLWNLNLPVDLLPVFARVDEVVPDDEAAGLCNRRLAPHLQEPAEEVQGLEIGGAPQLMDRAGVVADRKLVQAPQESE